MLCTTRELSERKRVRPFGRVLRCRKTVWHEKSIPELLYCCMQKEGAEGVDEFRLFYFPPPAVAHTRHSVLFVLYSCVLHACVPILISRLVLFVDVRTTFSPSPAPSARVQSGLRGVHHGWSQLRATMRQDLGAESPNRETLWGLEVIDFWRSRSQSSQG